MSSLSDIFSSEKIIASNDEIKNYFEKNSEFLFNEVKKTFRTKKVAIRSSSIHEDNNFSNAGKYHSELNVKIDKKHRLRSIKLHK
mgnify:CR=1 FL=1